jgi:hypothetical protein
MHLACVIYGKGNSYVTRTIPYQKWIVTVLLESKERNTVTVATVMAVNKNKNPEHEKV